MPCADVHGRSGGAHGDPKECRTTRVPPTSKRVPSGPEGAPVVTFTVTGEAPRPCPRPGRSLKSRPDAVPVQGGRDDTSPSRVPRGNRTVLLTAPTAPGHVGAETSEATEGAGTREVGGRPPLDPDCHRQRDKQPKSPDERSPGSQPGPNAPTALADRGGPEKRTPPVGPGRTRVHPPLPSSRLWTPRRV